MRVISLWQPWASLLVHAHKCVETRSFPLRGPFPQVLAIHAAKKWDSKLSTLCGEPHFWHCLDQIVPGAIWNGPVCPLPTGCVIGVVRVVECARMTAEMLAVSPALYGLTAQERAFGDYAPGRFAWVCDQFADFVPVPERGRQLFWDWQAPAYVQELADSWLANAKEGR